MQLSLLEALVEGKHLARKKAEEAARKVQETGSGVDQVLLESAAVSRSELLATLARVTGTESVDLSALKVSASVAQIIPKEMAERFNLICLKKEQNSVVVAMVDPKDSFAMEYVKMRTGFEVNPRCALPFDVRDAIEKAYAVKITFIGRDTPVKSDAERAGAGDEEHKERPKFVVATAQKSPRENILHRDSIRKKGESRAIRLEGFAGGVAAGSGDSEVPVLRALLEVGQDLNSNLQLDILVRKILQNAIDITDSEGASLILVTEEGNELFFKESLGPRSEDVKQLRFPLDEHSLVGYSIQNRVALKVNDVGRDPRHNKKVDTQVDFKTRSMLCCPVLWRSQPLGAITAVNKADNRAFTEADQEYLEILASQAAVALFNADLMERLTNFYTETVGILIDVLEVNDSISRDHLVAVARFSACMGQFINLSAPEIERLCYAGLLHDLGKVRCRDPHSPDHAAQGAAMLERVRLFRDLLPLIRHHHEWYDGSGFPDGLQGDEIPLLARILAVAEAFVEELTVVPVPERDEVVRRLRFEFGTRFDPDLKPAFEFALVNGA